jgi:hypothetical protein
MGTPCLSESSECMATAALCNAYSFDDSLCGPAVEQQRATGGRLCVHTSAECSANASIRQRKHDVLGRRYLTDPRLLAVLDGGRHWTLERAVRIILALSRQAERPPWINRRRPKQIR